MRYFSYLFFFVAFIVRVEAQENITYQVPSPEILQLADYTAAPSIRMSYDKKYAVFLYRSTYKSLADLNQPEVKLAGLRINPLTNISSTITYQNNIKIKSFLGQEERSVQGLPENPKIAYVTFSPDSKYLAFTNTTSKGVELWVVDLAMATAKCLSSDHLNANIGSPYTWYKNSQQLLVNKIPENRKPLIDANKDLPNGPIVSTSDGQVSQLRTYQDLLKSPQDEQNFITLITSELVTVDLKGNEQKWKDADLYIGQSLSPDGNNVLLTTLKKPFSYIVPYYSFPQEVNVYNIAGQLVKKVNDIPLQEIAPKGFSSTRKGKRSMGWRADLPATLSFVEALDEGDATKPVDLRDELFNWDAPFDNAPKSIIKLKDRYAGVVWGDSQHAVIYTSWYDTRNQKTYLFNPTTGANSLISDRNYQDLYSDPGDIFTDRNQFGQYVMYIDQERIYLIGEGYTKDGQFPFVDEYNLKSKSTKRLYTSNIAGKKESIVNFIDPKKGELLVSIESPSEYPNYYVRNMKSGKLAAVTSLKSPFKGLEGVHKEVIQYTRKDGVNLTGTLYLPAGYKQNPKEKLPLLIWAYPAEYKDKNSAGQSTANPNEFTFPYYGSFVYWVTKGYAVLDDAAFPIIGEGTTEPNDNFIEQLVSNAEAAIDAVDALGYIDRKRVAVGGHSYGAFMTANLLSHSKLFAAGIARSGAYNRTLTPFGFQREQRNYWDVPAVYNTMSPFMHADKMKTPMLLVHGAADNNPGTFTLQTERYFQALKNLGAPVRMVLLPNESHGYQAKENIFHLLWEQDQFLEKHLKNK